MSSCEFVKLLDCYGIYVKSCSGSVTVKEDWGISNIYDVRCFEAQTGRDILDWATQINQEVRLFSAGSVSASDDFRWSVGGRVDRQRLKLPTEESNHFYNLKFTILNLFCDFLHRNKTKDFLRYVLLSAEFSQSFTWVHAAACYITRPWSNLFGSKDPAVKLSSLAVNTPIISHR